MRSTTQAAAVCVTIAGIGFAAAMSGSAFIESSEALTQPVARSVALPLPNTEAKQDRLALAAAVSTEPQPATFALASAGPSASVQLPPVRPSPPVENVSRPTTVETTAKSLPSPAKPKLLAARPAPQQKTVLSDAQLTGIRQRLRLTPSQETHWPAVEAALRSVVRQLDDAKRRNPALMNAEAVDATSTSVQQLKMAAMPLLMQMREDQKQEVRMLARIIGLEQVAAQI